MVRRSNATIVEGEGSQRVRIVESAVSDEEKEVLRCEEGRYLIFREARGGTFRKSGAVSHTQV